MNRLALLAALLLTAAPAVGEELRVAPAPRAAFETVFDWSAEACATWHVPDAPARAWRAADGTVRLVAAHSQGRVMEGPSLDDLAPVCAVAFASGHEDDPARRDDHGWLAAVHTDDGATVHALVHDEFHGHRRPALCPAGVYRECWWNSVTAAVSRDGGRTFAAGGRAVASLPYRYRGDLGRRAGVFSPSNIVRHDGWLHVFVFAEALGAQRRGVCLLRTRDMGDPASWRAWDGQSFTIRFADPYAEPVADPERHVCRPLPPDRLPFTVGGVVRHAPSGRFVAVMAGERAAAPGEPKITGIWAATSADLIRWTPPHLVAALQLLTHPDCAQGHAYAYPAVIDHDSPSRTFQGAGDAPRLYLTRIALDGCRPTADRDLVRLPLTIRPARE